MYTAVDSGRTVVVCPPRRLLQQQQQQQQCRVRRRWSRHGRLSERYRNVILTYTYIIRICGFMMTLYYVYTRYMRRRGYFVHRAVTHADAPRRGEARRRTAGAFNNRTRLSGGGGSGGGRRVHAMMVDGGFPIDDDVQCPTDGGKGRTR